jgi:hypothetical protein
MFEAFKEFLRSIVASSGRYETMEQYIVAHKPVDIHDIDRLEREFEYLQAGRTYHYF